MLKLSNKYGYGKTVSALAIIAFIFGCIGISFGTLGIIILPFIAAFLGALFAFERKKIASIIVPFALVLIELFVNLKFSFTFTNLTATFIALIMALCFGKKWDKRESAFSSMILVALLICLVTFFAISKFTRTYELDAAFDFFRNSIRETKRALLQQFSSLPETEYSKVYSDILSSEYLSEVFDMYINCIPSILLILGFIISGISHKLFTKLIYKYSADTDSVQKWIFINTRLFAYFYAVVAVISVFSASKDSVFSISVMNLHLLFMVIFAYTGYSFLHEFLESKIHNRFLATLILIAAIAFLSSFALQIFSVVGTLVTILYTKISGRDHDTFNDDKSSN